MGYVSFREGNVEVLRLSSKGIFHDLEVATKGQIEFPGGHICMKKWTTEIRKILVWIL